MPDPTPPDPGLSFENPDESEPDPSEVVARHPEFPPLEPKGGAAAGTTLDSLRDVPLTISVRLGHAVMPIAEVLKLGPGSVVELEEAVGSPVELTVRGVAFAVGEVVVVDDHFAIRIKHLLPPRAWRTDS